MSLTGANAEHIKNSRFDTVRIGFNICYGESCSKWLLLVKSGRENNNGAKRLPGRPRSEQARQAILAQHAELLQHTGFPELTIEAIAADAGVGKATVYRWWPNKGALVVDAFASSAEDKLHFPDTGSVYQDMSLQMNQFLAILRSRAAGALWRRCSAADSPIPSCWKPFANAFCGRGGRRPTRPCGGESNAASCPATWTSICVLDILYGAIYMRFLIRHDELSESYVREVCRLVLDGRGSGIRAHQGATGA